MNIKLFSNAIYIIFFSFILFTLGYKHTFAVRPAPEPNCQISGIVKSVKIEPPIVPKENPGAFIYPPPFSRPAGYSIGIKIEFVSYVSGDSTYHTCEENHIINQVDSFFIAKDEVRPGDVFSVNQKIKGIVSGQYFLDQSYILSKNEGEKLDPTPEEEQVSNFLEIYEISKKLVDGNYAHKINNIWLQPEQEIYRVDALKRGKLFLFIPINFNFEIIVDAKTGTVNSIKEPWWMSLFSL